MAEIKLGDIVELKSGGPKMTVSQIGKIRDVPSAWCDWFETTKKQTGAFPLHSLKLVEG